MKSLEVAAGLGVSPAALLAEIRFWGLSDHLAIVADEAKVVSMHAESGHSLT